MGNRIWGTGTGAQDQGIGSRGQDLRDKGTELGTGSGNMNLDRIRDRIWGTGSRSQDMLDRILVTGAQDLGTEGQNFRDKITVMQVMPKQKFHYFTASQYSLISRIEIRLLL